MRLFILGINQYRAHAGNLFGPADIVRVAAHKGFARSFVILRNAQAEGFVVFLLCAAGDLVGVVHKGNACNRVHHNCNDSRAHVAGGAGLYGRYSNVNGAVLPVGRLANVGRGIRGVFNGGHSAARRHTDHSPLRDLCARRTGEGNDTGRSVRRASGKAVSPGVAVKVCTIGPRRKHQLQGFHKVEIQKFVLFKRCRIGKVPRETAFGVVNVGREAFHHARLDLLCRFGFQPVRRRKCRNCGHALTSLL